MELNILKDEKNLLEVELVGEGHTLTNAIKEELKEDSKVSSATYVIEHPLTSSPKLTIRTSSGSPKTALKAAAARLEKKAGEFRGKFKKAK